MSFSDTSATAVEQDFLVTVASLPSESQLVFVRRGIGPNCSVSVRRVVMVQVNRRNMRTRVRVAIRRGRCADLHALFSDAGKEF